MNITKKEFFKRKNRKTLYKIYLDTIEQAHNVSESYRGILKILNDRKDKYRGNEHIYKLISSMISNYTEEFEFEALRMCSNVKADQSVIDVRSYNSLLIFVQRLSDCTQRLGALNYFLDYIEQRKLNIRK